MVKNIEWLKKEIESDGVQLEYIYANYYTDDKAIMIDDVRHLIDQLDEPEITEEQAWNKIAESYPADVRSLVTSFQNFYYGDLVKKPTISKKETVEVPQFVANREEEKLYKLKFISKTITETHYMAYRFFSGEYKPMTTNSMGLSNGAVGWRYIFTESELETMDTTGFERVEVKE